MGTVALGIRHVVCVPLNFVQYVESADAKGEDRRIGVLYLDSRERGSLASEPTRAALETLAAEASVAIENARLYREKLEKAQAWSRKCGSPPRSSRPCCPSRAPASGSSRRRRRACRAGRSAATSSTTWTTPGSRFGFALGDVAGKGPPAALLSALMQGMFAAHAHALDGPATAITRINRSLCRRGIESRFVTVLLGNVSVDGRLTYCNGGHNPPFVIGRSGRAPARGGRTRHWPARDAAPFEQETIQLDPGDVVVIFSDGVSEAMSLVGRGIRRRAPARRGAVPAWRSRSRRKSIGSSRPYAQFAKGAPQSDDITVMVLRYLGSGAA